MRPPSISTLVLTATVLTLVASAFATIAMADKAPSRNGPVLAELFTSQGCSSCPPAEAFFDELSGRDGLVTIEWHVDYWDDLVHRGSRWEDPYSDPAFTQRQRDYNAVLRGTRGVYTPQAIINGSAEMTGSRRKDVQSAIDAAAPPSADLTFSSGEVMVSGDGDGAVYFVRLLMRHETAVKGGENKGRQLRGQNIAREYVKLGAWTGAETSFDLPALKDGETCAIIVQHGSISAPGPVLAARYCPS